MSTKPDLGLKARKENNRNTRPAVYPQHFELDEIKEHFDEGYSTIEWLGIVAHDLLDKGDTEGYLNMLRAQIFFLESILDFYIHEISKYSLYNMFSGTWGCSDRYYGIVVPLREVETALHTSDSKEWFFDFINRQMRHKVFLSPDNMTDQLNQDGIPFREVMHRVFNCSTENQSHKMGRKFIQDLYDRRNAIAHQGDRDHETSSLQKITEDFVNESCEKVKAIVNAIYDIAVEK